MSKENYFDRELSWLDFNARVLAEAMDETNPLLERLKFMGIVSANLDEFFMVRAASLNAQDPILPEVYQKAFSLMDQQGQYFSGKMVPEMEAAGIVRISPQGLNDKQKEYLTGLFHKEIFPLLTPIALRSDHPMPALSGHRLYRVIELIEPKDPQTLHYAVIEIPKKCPRMVTLASEQAYAFILIEDLVALFAGELFPGYEITGQGILRLTRAAELSLDEEKDEDFAKVMTEALRMRQRSLIVRMEFEGSARMLDFLSKKLEVPARKIYRFSSWADLKGIAQLAFQPTFPELKREPWVPKPQPDFSSAEDVWALLREKDVMVHHPYESFDAFLLFLSQAVRDPDVLAIKQTLYRAGDPSRVIRLLEEAAENGKQVTAILELKARFDEERNIEWAERLMNAGASVLYGVAGFKTHAKVCLVVRREVEGIRRYVHLSTGNYNEKTAQIYSDLGYFSSRDDLTRDIASFFNIVTGFSHPVGFSRIEMSPFGLRRKIEKLILRETLRSQKDQPGLILAKMNSLVDKELIQALYKASQQGVQIKLNVRGVCGLVPGVKGLSDNIEVTSIVDMFLEHSRIFYFYNGGEEEVYLSSADWMPRNLDRRLEILFPVIDERHKKNTIELLKLYFRDNVKSWILGADGIYRKREQGNDKKFRVQDYLCKHAAESLSALAKPVIKDLKPQKPKEDVRSAEPKTPPS